MTTLQSQVELPRTSAIARVPWKPFVDHDPVTDVFEPWTVLPQQLHDGTRAAECSGEKRLMAAVLTDAIHVYLKYRGCRVGSGAILFREADRWIHSTERGWLLSFENVCDVLQIDAGRLRRALATHATTDGRRPLPVDAGRLRVSRGRKIRV